MPIGAHIYQMIKQNDMHIHHNHGQGRSKKFNTPMMPTLFNPVKVMHNMYMFMLGVRRHT